VWVGIGVGLLSVLAYKISRILLVLYYAVLFPVKVFFEGYEGKISDQSMRDKLYASEVLISIILKDKEGSF
jgi:hypothetical protein